MQLSKYVLKCSYRHGFQKERCWKLKFVQNCFEGISSVCILLFYTQGLVGEVRPLVKNSTIWSHAVTIYFLYFASYYDKGMVLWTYIDVKKSSNIQAIKQTNLFNLFYSTVMCH